MKVRRGDYGVVRVAAGLWAGDYALYFADYPGESAVVWFGKGARTFLVQRRQLERATPGLATRWEKRHPALLRVPLLRDAAGRR